MSSGKSRRKEVLAEGVAARRRGEPESSNPYRGTGRPGLACNWTEGWWREEGRVQRQRAGDPSQPHIPVIGAREKRHAGHIGSKNRI